MIQLVTTAFSTLFIGFIAAWLLQAGRMRLRLAEQRSRAASAVSAEIQRRAAAEAQVARLPALETAIEVRDAALFDLKMALAAQEARWEAERRSVEKSLASMEDAHSKVADSLSGE